LKQLAHKHLHLSGWLPPRDTYSRREVAAALGAMIDDSAEGERDGAAGIGPYHICMNAYSHI